MTKTVVNIIEKYNKTNIDPIRKLPWATFLVKK